MNNFSINVEIVKMMKWVIRTYIGSGKHISLGCLEKSLRQAWQEMVENEEIVIYK